MPKKFENFDNPRQKAIDGMRNSISADAWNNNVNFLKTLRAEISNHPVSKHPAIQLLNDGLIDKETLKHIHLEYRHAIVQVFTDALLMAQFQTKQLEPRLLSGSKMYPRFLLNLNILDEFGFRPALDKDEYYSGNPEYAHYPLFEDVLDDFELTQEERNNYLPSIIAQKVRSYLENSFHSYRAVTALLAVAEEEVILFSPALRQATHSVGFDVSSGYYHVHGVSDDTSSEGADDDHEDDLWFVLAQACTGDDYAAIRKICFEYCDLWQQFWDEQIASYQYEANRKLA
ncbi:iron-containing redox enzyme family protein [Acinetobacter sp. NIPH 2699]|uniref:iron-containing redox enzyme family protein n=1 Tax=Acinetobacter sp. NIPH 2699 TaxID=2923433 RepID=UPI001F4B8003|nr:iron-containing redox enzyme family protein [Acinetobacter sp. NIPH 2699]MCH7336779.1 iron-containing redox enzyme family protein [Acinetobacter sp. NIPH 2699]